LVLIEAQAAGLPITVSNSVTKEIDVVPRLLTWLSLSESASVWADTIFATLEERCSVPQFAAHDILKKTPFDIQASIHSLAQIYDRETNI